MKNFLTILMVVFLISCRTNQPPQYPASTAAIPSLLPSPAGEKSGWDIYDPDPEHAWNRVFRQLYGRTAAHGEEYGADELDPLLWFDTSYLLAGISHRQTLQVLDEFLSADADDLIGDPLKRAMFQRDLWAVFDWSSSQDEPYAIEREALQVRLVEIMKRVALSKVEILALQDNYALAVKSAAYPAVFQKNEPETAFLPDLFRLESAWLPVGREGGPTAMTHTEAFPFFGRSVFFVFVRSPDGRDETLDFINSLNSEPSRALTMGVDVALVRRMLLIDDMGEPVLSPLVEAIQVRHYSPMQTFYEFELDRRRLFASLAGGLVPNDDLFMLFMGHGDVFENSVPKLQAEIPEICQACHFESPPLPNYANTQSIISYSRHPFPLPENARPILFATTMTEEARTVIEWKQGHDTWKSLETLWEQASP